jgi:hypothetical protein
MRFPILLSLLASSCLLFPGLAKAATACDPSKPLNGVFCAHQLCLPSQQGTTTMDFDGRTIIACLNDGTGRMIWKVSTDVQAAEGGGGSYTSWGNMGCAQGWNTAYQGKAIALVSWAPSATGGTGTGVSGVICSDQPISYHGNNTTGWVYWTAGNDYWADPHGPENVIPCAVCVK